MKIKLFFVLALILQLAHPLQNAVAADPNMAAAMGDMEQLKSLLVASPSTIEARSGTGMTPLMSASAAGEKDIAKYLLSLSAKVNAQDDEGWSPLHHAAAEGREDVIKLLLEQGADTSLKTKDGRTPSDLADKIQFDYSRKQVKALLEGKSSAEPK